MNLTAAEDGLEWKFEEELAGRGEESRDGVGCRSGQGVYAKVLADDERGGAGY